MIKYKVVISPNSNYYNAISYSFGEDAVFEFDEKNSIKKIEKYASSLGGVQNIVFYNLTEANDLLLNMLSNNSKKYIIFEYSVSELSDYKKLNELLLLLKYIDMNLVDGIICIDYVTYMLLKDKYGAKYLKLDVLQTKGSTGNSIGIIDDSSSVYGNTINELSAITLTNYKNVKTYKPIRAVSKFAKRFNLKLIKSKSISECIDGNTINFYGQFSSICYPFILESMDRGIPCIVGNTDFFDGNEVLKSNLVLKSDDDINEMNDKILSVEKNKQIILNEYAKFRKEYTKLAKKSIKDIKELFNLR